MTELIYKDQIKLSFNEGEHKYVVSHLVNETWSTPVPVTGTTSITSIIAKDALIQWASNEACKYFVENLKDIDDLAAIASVAKNAHREKAKLGKAHGSVGHAMVEALLKGEQVTMPTKEPSKTASISVRKAFESFREEFKPITIMTERPFYSLTHNFAGTADYICEINERLWLIDFKTTNSSYYNPDGIYAENYAQLGAYALGLEEMLDMEFDELAVVNLPKDGSEYKIKTLSDLGLTKTDAELYFLNCLGLYELNKSFNWKLKN